MKEYTVYKCDYCSFESTSFSRMEEHEAGHFGLTVEDFHYWKSLKDNVRNCSSNASKIKNRETERLFDEAIEKLLAFEKAHGIEDE